MYQKIVPHLWFNTEAKEAADFYADVFPDSKVISSCVFSGPEGDSEALIFEVMGYRFMSISAGPYFTKNPTISFLIPYSPEETDLINQIWERLLDGGKALMDLGEYPFNKHYGWVEDKYDVSWQFYLMEEEQEEPYSDRVVPTLMFVNDVAGKAEDAMKFYVDIFKESKDKGVYHYPEGMEPNLPEHVMHGEFKLEGQSFTMQDSAEAHDFNFNEGISLLVNCDTQEEIDYYWDKLTYVPESEQCGWLKDKFGLSWQISPKVMDDVMGNGTKEEIERVTEAFMKMKKFDLAEIERAYKGES